MLKGIYFPVKNQIGQIWIPTTVSNIINRDKWHRRSLHDPWDTRLESFCPLCAGSFTLAVPFSFQLASITSRFSFSNEVLKTQFSILQSALLDKMKCKATKNIWSLGYRPLLWWNHMAWPTSKAGINEWARFSGTAFNCSLLSPQSLRLLLLLACLPLFLMDHLPSGTCTERRSLTNSCFHFFSTL